MLASLALIACGEGTGPSDDNEDSLPPTLGNIAGAYSATVFTGGGYDVLAVGGGLEMTLGSDGSVTGTMDIPAAAGGPFNADMAGTYTVMGNSLTFTQAADTFVRDATWTWTNGVLNGSWSGGGTTVTVRMER
jgi:hypothetical protein